ncbi:MULTISPECIES: phosphatidylserine decarboxylase family protein [Paraburkholderia]|uniref:Phosphatidylserine decarboxylase n=1 Tax=Paraburkholderia fungorum TaxID=134537 RepID=A0AAW3UXQ9_9BURK|nr:MULTISPECIES: phosphatidylserine decarboxylase family protein [Paraburkholderia]KFX64412.1 phosphatidylserine decarboxylase [Burkholderia sp. K24]MBB4515476.1 phosphatidylserine decarboxylase [Paraburkholderia fungorum]MBB6203419.1 phosphatidylserine decarboxylase [Paraburkholderia fungorum]USX07391.1 phosphatidylserine decarboxylase family protein [Paraburkholderia fungorum]
MDDDRTNPIEERRRLGGWLPRKEDELVAFRKDLSKQAQERTGLVPRMSAVADLAALINGDPVLRMDLTRAIGDAITAGYELGYSTIGELMDIVDYLMTYSPRFSEASLIHCPLNAVLDWPMCMPSGYALFRDPALNAQLKRVLNVWCGFLSGPHSRTHLNTSAPKGWFSPEAQKQLDMSQFICDPDKPYWGYSSWNSFFTRNFRYGIRPVAEPDNSKVIVTACEASPYNIQHDVKLHDQFWIKSQPYSLQEIFTAGQRELAVKFVGGSVYQAFLSAFNYHRWHAPVSGRIVRAYHVDGSYYSGAESEGIDPGGLNDSQGYTTAVATRAVIVIDCDDSQVGLVGCIFVGMADVSSCVIEALPGQRVEKGDELGYFQYGGSTYCLVFRPNVVRSFVSQPPFDDEAPPLEVNSHVATAR